MAGFAGAIIALTTRHVTPALSYWTTSGELVFIAILGGAGSVLGPFLGAAAYELTRVYAGGDLRQCLAAGARPRAARRHRLRAGRDLGDDHEPQEGRMTALLQARDLRLAFGGLKAADGIDLDVEAGEFLAIIGPNGRGKTTFINMTTGYLKPQGGTIAFEGKPILGLSPRRIVGLGVARSFQLPQLFTEHTVLQNVALAVASREGVWSVLNPLLRPRFRTRRRN